MTIVNVAWQGGQTLLGAFSIFERPALVTGNPVIMDGISNTLFTGRPKVGAPGLRWTDVAWDFSEALPTAQAAMLEYTASMRGYGGLVIDGFTMKGNALSKNWFLNGFRGGFITLRNGDISGVVDGIRFDFPTRITEPSTLSNLKIHDGAHYSWVAPEVGDGQSSKDTHGDGIQFANGSGPIAASGLNISGFSNSSIFISQGNVGGLASVYTSIDIGHSVLGSAPASINLSVSNGNDLSMVTIHDTVISPATATYEVLVGAGVKAILANLTHPDGTAARIVRK